MISSSVTRATIALAVRVLALAVLTLALGTSACGNYSNEDLEFMNAIPQRQDLSVDVPPRAAALITDAAESWQTTWKVTVGLNAVADAFLGLIEAIRSYYPSSRDGAVRIWGPFPDKNNAGWRIEFRMVKVGDTRFDYGLFMLPPPGVVLSGGGLDTAIIAGNFLVGGGVRRGVGQLIVSLDEARAAGAHFPGKTPDDPGLENLRRLQIDYDTQSLIRRVDMDILNVPPADPAMEAARAMYRYQNDGGASTMQFTFLKDAIPGPLGIETMDIQSRWLERGEGRATTRILAGDGAGATVVECWDHSFQSVYRENNWDPFMQPFGDPAGCIP
jgi:hypothetical protein